MRYATISRYAAKCAFVVACILGAATPRGYYQITRGQPGVQNIPSTKLIFPEGDDRNLNILRPKWIYDNDGGVEVNLDYRYSDQGNRDRLSLTHASEFYLEVYQFGMPSRWLDVIVMKSYEKLTYRLVRLRIYRAVPVLLCLGAVSILTTSILYGNGLWNRWWAAYIYVFTLAAFLGVWLSFGIASGATLIGIDSIGEETVAPQGFWLGMCAVYGYWRWSWRDADSVIGSE